MTFRDEIYYREQDSFVREKPEWAKDIPKHIKEYLKKGGKITQCAPGEGVYAKRYQAGNKHAFVINPNKGK